MEQNSEDEPLDPHKEWLLKITCENPSLYMYKFTCIQNTLKSYKKLDNVFGNINAWIITNANNYKKRDKILNIVSR